MDEVTNVAMLPGIQRASYAMPDAHWGYGFPIVRGSTVRWPIAKSSRISCARHSPRPAAGGPGISMIASRLDVPVVPVRLEGVDRVLHHTWHMARPGHVRVTFGPPMRLAGGDFEGLAKQVEDAVRSLPFTAGRPVDSQRKPQLSS